VIASPEATQATTSPRETAGGAGSAARPKWRSRRRWRHVAAGAVVAGVAGALYVIGGLPSRAEVRSLAHANPKETSVMRQRDAEARATGRRPRRIQSWVSLGQVSRHLVHAVVAAEDPKFFGHEGIDWEAVRESVETNVKRRRFARGGSTITQQLAKNLFYTTRKSVVRKLREMIVAGWLEEDLSKKRILELYLNVIEWGDGVYGCGAAAMRYYGKSVGSLDDAEAAGLAAMIPSPRRINPRVNPARYARAQRRILRLMTHAGYVSRAVGTLGTEPTPTPEESEEAEDAGPEPHEPE
jgi:monofunctional biosynthetic peptidoglycan transglycosylase